MRGIKYRVWDKVLKRWAKGIMLQQNGEVTSTHINDYEICMSTGLKDKNGVEIYKGDIIHYECGRTCEVCWHDRTANFDSKAYKIVGISRPLGDRPDILAEVIGNIYENPELLEGK